MSSSSGSQQLPPPIPNKQGEPEFQLKLSHEYMIFPGATPGQPKNQLPSVELIITNPTQDKHAIKVKCTSAELFRVHPPMGVVAKGGQLSIRFFLQNKGRPPSSQMHYFAIYHTRCDAATTDTQSRYLWKGPLRFDGLKRLPVVFPSSAT
ncbi:unnamed protein product, partial [Mesorhabditis spiculigera]